MKKLINIVQTALGIAIWLLPIAVWLISCYFGITLLWMPLFDLYGFWNTIGIVTALNAAVFASLLFWNWLVDQLTIDAPMTFKENDDA